MANMKALRKPLIMNHAPRIASFGEYFELDCASSIQGRNLRPFPKGSMLNGPPGGFCRPQASHDVACLAPSIRPEIKGNIASMRLLYLLTLITVMTSTALANTIPVFFGTGQNRDFPSEGVYGSTFNTESGKFATPPSVMARLESPGFLVQHPSKPILYAIGADPESGKHLVSSFKIGNGKSGPSLDLLNAEPTNCAKGTHLDVDPSGRLLVCVQYGQGTVSVFPVAEDGSLAPTSQTISHEAVSTAHPKRQGKPHPHNATFDPTGRFVLIPDLGADLVYVYEVDFDHHSLKEHARIVSAPGAGPRHMTFNGQGDRAYVVNELDMTVDTYSWDAETGSLVRLSTVETLPEDVLSQKDTNTGSEIKLHPSGQFLYSGNRGDDSISVFKIEADTGIPERIAVTPSGVAWPRHFSLTPDGRFLLCAGQFSHSVNILSVDEETGLLQATEAGTSKVPSPICVLPLEQGN
jgi:6-phosphogluconolactonase